METDEEEPMHLLRYAPTVSLKLYPYNLSAIKISQYAVLFSLKEVNGTPGHK